MEKIKWCKKQAKGIILIEPNENISKSYIEKADESLEMIEKATQSWKVICSYYACYDSLYALYIKAGIKCEIHECSLELMKLFNFEKKYIEFMKQLKEDRINVQYYVNQKFTVPDIKIVKSFILKIKEKIFNLNQTEINRIKEEIKKY